MSKISEIRLQIHKEFKDSSQQGVYTPEEFNRAIIVAYNKGIDDVMEAVKLKQTTRFSVMIDFEALLKLKIGG